MLVARFSTCDALVPVPLHRWRRVGRGFNQSHELARRLTGVLGQPIWTGATRVRATALQSGLSAAERRRNLGGVFRIRSSEPPRCPLIIDDVMTTGSTVTSLAAALRDAGSVRVSVLVLARADLGSHSP